MDLTFEQVRAARERQMPYVRRTPTDHSPDLSGMVDREVYLKLENLQRTGAFKLRGAVSRLLTIAPGKRERGVITASAGNHGQGVALAAKLLGAPATVVLPCVVPPPPTCSKERTEKVSFPFSPRRVMALTVWKTTKESSPSPPRAVKLVLGPLER